MPSTETRRYADLITLIREIVNDAAEDNSQISTMRAIVALTNKEEEAALIEFGNWFRRLEDE